MEFTVRRAGPEDAPILNAITRESYVEHPGCLNPPPKADCESVEDVALATSGGEHAGAVRYVLAGADLLIERLAVRPAFRRHGAARALLAFAEEEGRSAGARRVCLDMPLQATAVGRYRHCGYRTVGLRLRSENEVSVTMVKWLVPQARDHGGDIGSLRDLAAQLRREEPAAIAVLLFGSAARGDPMPFSDVDVRVITRGEPLMRERLQLRDLPHGLQQVSVSARSMRETFAAAEVPEEWLWMQEAFNEALALWDPQAVLPAIRGRIADAEPSRESLARSASRDLDALLELTAKAKNAAACGDAAGVLLSAHEAAAYAVRLLAVLNPPARRLTASRMLAAAAGFRVAPEHFAQDVAVCLGAAEDGPRDTGLVLARCLRLGSGLLSLLAQHAGNLPLRSDLLPPLRDGRLARLLVQEEGLDPHMAT